jgi:hypothetical protein
MIAVVIIIGLLYFKLAIIGVAFGIAKELIGMGLTITGIFLIAMMALWLAGKWMAR